MPTEPTAPDVAALITHFKSRCNRYVNGACTTSYCLKRGGWIPGGEQNADAATCPDHEVIGILHAQAAEIDRLRAGGCTRDNEAALEAAAWLKKELAAREAETVQLQTAFEAKEMSDYVAGLTGSLRNFIDHNKALYVEASGLRVERDALRAELATLHAPVDDEALMEDIAIASMCAWDGMTYITGAMFWNKWKAAVADETCEADIRATCADDIETWTCVARAVLAVVAPRLRAAWEQGAAITRERSARTVSYLGSSRWHGTPIEDACDEIYSAIITLPLPEPPQ